ncbi:MAG: succinate dehydrogenase, hydrophobic membrane anchor protein [Hyphomonadaceae bacterium]|jgi:succinate dehydrogenase / fumarate reductase membrane anchor subunit|nr:succinate dehydrogenase, hydrophobic membrane anchor protein [Hyphomonadaceae bacterium]
MKSTMRTPLGKVRGLGASGKGPIHFMQQRGTAVALALLLPWFALSVIFGTDGSYDSVTRWLAHPVNAAVTLLTVITGIYHMRLGLDEVINDYLHKPGTKLAAFLANTFIPLGLAVMAGLAVLKLYAGA